MISFENYLYVSFLYGRNITYTIFLVFCGFRLSFFLNNYSYSWRINPFYLT